MHDDPIPVVTIDGPSGSGKGTISRLLARELGFHFLDSGALYRLLALAAHRRGVPLDDERQLVTLCDALDIRFPSEHEAQTVLLDGADVTREIRSEAAGAGASRVAALPGVRAALLARQRSFREAPGLVADGRDMGTIVFPDAAVKLFLTASSEERAKRRCIQLKEMGIEYVYAEVLADIKARDARDAGRAVAPLKAADDAQVVDTTELDIGATLEQVRRLVGSRLNP
jgi:cytidylate kinase